MQIDRAKVKRQMKIVGIKQFAEVATGVGVTRQSLARWFAGDQFSSQSLGALIRVLNCTPNDVLSWDGERATAPHLAPAKTTPAAPQPSAIPTADALRDAQPTKPPAAQPTTQPSTAAAMRAAQRAQLPPPPASEAGEPVRAADVAAVEQRRAKLLEQAKQRRP